MVRLLTSAPNVDELDEKEKKCVLYPTKLGLEAFLFTDLSDLTTKIKMFNKRKKLLLSISKG